MSCAPAQPTKRYILGNAVTVRSILTGMNDEVIDPVNLRMIVIGPSDVASTVVAMTVEGDNAIGIFTPDEIGVWRYRVETYTGPVNAALERTVLVTERSVPSP